MRGPISFPRRPGRELLLLAALGFLLSGAETGRAIEWRGARSQAEYRTWTIDNPGGGTQTISQLYIPLITTVRLGTGRNLVVSMEAASSDSSRSSMDGFSDVRLHLFQALAGDRVIVTAGFTLPSGTKGLTETELRVVQALSQPIRGFRLKQYGAGSELTIAGAIQIPLGAGTRGGVGAGFTYRGEYALLDGRPDYRPSPELALTAGIEVGGHYRTDEWRGGHLGASWRHFGKDEEAGRTVFEEGDQIDVEGEMRFEKSSMQGQISTLLIFKRDNISYSEPLTSIKTSSGRGVFCHASIQTRLSGAWTGGMAGELRSFSGSDIAGRDGHTLGVGPSVSTPLGRSQLGVRAMFLWGSEASSGGKARELRGFSLALFVGVGAD